jgi:preprotein translocase subunit SecG
MSQLMYTAIIIVHTLACIALILIVLLQTGKGADMGAAFGGASQTLFGGSGGTTFLSKLTTGAAIVFMLTCISLTKLSSGPPQKSIMDSLPAQQSQGPVVPEAKPVAPAPSASSEPAPKAQESEATSQPPAQQPAAPSTETAPSAQPQEKQ